VKRLKKIQVYLSRDEMKQFKVLADKDKRTVSEYARLLLTREMERIKEHGNSEKESES